MDETILTWNMTNWITVFLMVFLGFIVIGVISQSYKSLSNQDG